MSSNRKSINKVFEIFDLKCLKIPVHQNITIFPKIIKYYHKQNLNFNILYILLLLLTFGLSLVSLHYFFVSSVWFYHKISYTTTFRSPCTGSLYICIQHISVTSLRALILKIPSIINDCLLYRKYDVNRLIYFK